MPYSLFISDLHLSDERPETVQLFLKFLIDRASQADNLYILGDLFDVWVGDDDDSETGEKVVNALKQLSELETRVFIMHGNRDFLIGQQFCQASNSTLLADPTVISIGTKRILLTHGDQLCTGDAAYQQARKMRSQPAWLESFLDKNLSERKTIAAQYREQSGEAKSMLANDIMDVTEAEVEQWFDKYNADVMIHGHTHRPAIHQLSINGALKTRVVLAEWHHDCARAIQINDQLQISNINVN